MLKTNNSIEAVAPPAPWQDVPWEKWEDWHWQIANRISDVETSSKVIHLTGEEKEIISKSLNTLRMAITPYFASLMDPDDPQDPIRMRAVPTLAETYISPEICSTLSTKTSIPRRQGSPIATRTKSCCW